MMIFHISKFYCYHSTPEDNLGRIETNGLLPIIIAVLRYDFVCVTADYALTFSILLLLQVPFKIMFSPLSYSSKFF